MGQSIGFAPPHYFANKSLSSSPYINRFLQPDTIIPDPSNPQSWNRYSYVLNNPITLNDPTGHDPYSTCGGNEACMAYVEANPESDFINNWTDPVSLTHKDDPIPGSDKRVTYGGAAAYEMYTQYQEDWGWWNDDGNADFGLAEFLGMWALFEAAGNLDAAKVIAIIIAQNLYNGGNNPAACPTGKCFNGAFNFMAAYSGGTTGVLNGGTTAYANDYEGYYPEAYGDGANKRSLISMLGKIALSRSSLDPGWTQKTGPSNWGNVTNSYPGWLQAVRKAADTQKDPSIQEYKINGTAQNTVYYYYGDAFFYSIAQRDFWNPPK